jgi:hypothetical protein
MQGKIYMTTRTTISLSFEELTQLRELSKLEHRPISRQIIYMMELYIKQK